jgi:hypothetical protein
MSAIAVDPGGDLDDGVVGQPGQRPVVPDVDDLDIAATIVERRHELGRRLRVEGPAAVLEERWLGMEARIAVQVEELRLDLDDLVGPGVAVTLLGQDGIELVVVAQVIGRDRAEHADEVGRHAHHLAEPVRIGLDHLGQSVDAVDTDRSLPAQVIEAHVLEGDALGLDVEVGREPALQPDRDVAEADGAVTCVQEGLGHDADGVGEVDQPGAGGGAPLGLGGDVQDDGNRAEGLREAAGAGGLLADRSEPERQPLVHAARGLAADPELYQHEPRAVEGGVEVVGDGQPTGPVEGLEHSPRQATDDLPSLGVDVVQHELVDRDPPAARRESLDQLRGVGGAATDDRDLQAHQLRTLSRPNLHLDTTGRRRRDCL